MRLLRCVYLRDCVGVLLRATFPAHRGLYRRGERGDQVAGPITRSGSQVAICGNTHMMMMPSAITST